jgi:hypothetical protein
MAISEEIRNQWKERILFIEEFGDINEWESEFIDNISFLLSNEKDLSQKQSYKLQEIFCKTMEDYEI